MKLVPTDITGPARVVFYLALLSVIMMIALDLSNWPPVLQSWEGENQRFIQDIRFAIPAYIFLLIIAVWVFTHWKFFRQNRMYQLRFLMLFFAFFFMPLSGLLILTITSDGFKHSPNDNPESIKLYDLLDNIQFIVFVGFCFFLIILYFLKKKNTFEEDFKKPTHQA